MYPTLSVSVNRPLPSYWIFEKIVEGNKGRRNEGKMKECLCNVSLNFTKCMRSVSKLPSPLYIRLPTFSHVYCSYYSPWLNTRKTVRCYEAKWLWEKCTYKTPPKNPYLTERKSIIMPCCYTFSNRRIQIIHFFSLGEKWKLLLHTSFSIKPEHTKQLSSHAKMFLLGSRFKIWIL